MKKRDDEDTEKEEDVDTAARTSDDAQFIDDDGDGDSPSALAQKLREKLRVCEQERQEYLQGWQRAKADFINARKDDEKERSALRKHAKVDIITEILPIVDNFERAMANKELWEKVDKNWRVGVEYIYTQLQVLLHNHSVQAIGKVGECFDTQIHQAMEALPVPDKEKDDTVVEVVEKGYQFHDRVIRPARVNIGHYKEVNEAGEK